MLPAGSIPTGMKVAEGILLQKQNKLDYSVVKTYRLISLLNCLGKMVEKISADAIAHHGEITGELHPG